jgi:hypothetical protein
MLWMLPGAALMFLLVAAANHFQDRDSPSAKLAFKANRVNLVSSIQLSLSAATEAEKNAVMATNDQDSRNFAEQARQAAKDVEREWRDLEARLGTGGTPAERALLVQFSRDFAELERIDDELLPLAVRNTNLKAYRLAFEPAAAASEAMRTQLGRLVDACVDLPRASTILSLAFKAEASALRIETLLAPHIAEESDEKMDSLEARMAKEDAQVRAALDGLRALPKLRHDGNLAAATASYATFTELRTEILALSRENTNVRSLAVSLNRKRKVASICQEVLRALKQSIAAEPVPGVTFARPAAPR